MIVVAMLAGERRVYARGEYLWARWSTAGKFRVISRDSRCDGRGGARALLYFLPCCRVNISVWSDASLAMIIYDASGGEEG